jgi:very-short-patch-repair endonuclease
MGSLSGIVEVIPHYRTHGYTLDFFIPELNTGIEYDEYRHEIPAIKSEDILRQNKLTELTGIKFIRIQQGNEIGGINEIIKLVIVNSISRVLRPFA